MHVGTPDHTQAEDRLGKERHRAGGHGPRGPRAGRLPVSAPAKAAGQDDEGIVKVSDGIVFPILAALSRFVKRVAPCAGIREGVGEAWQGNVQASNESKALIVPPDNPGGIFFAIE
jgi:hypothetical protein